jgi:hypothetical protein
MNSLFIVGRPMIFGTVTSLIELNNLFHTVKYKNFFNLEMSVSHCHFCKNYTIHDDEVNVWIYLLLYKKKKKKKYSNPKNQKTVIVLFYILNLKIVFNASDLIFTGGKCHCYFFRIGNSIRNVLF